MSRMNFLSESERQAFDTPPVLSAAERSQYFEITPSTEKFLVNLRSPENRVYFVLLLGYFKATKRFFNQGFHQDDLRDVAAKLGVVLEILELKIYDRASYQRHKEMILEQLGFRELDNTAKAQLLTELHPLIRSHKRPRLIFLHALEVLTRQKIALPTYHSLSTIISEALRKHHDKLIALIAKQFTPEQQALLEMLFDKETKVEVSNKSSQAPQLPEQSSELAQDETQRTWQRYRLTLLKHFSHSTQPSKIRTTVADVATLRELYETFSPILVALDIPHEGIRYYAQSVIDSLGLSQVRWRVLPQLEKTLVAQG
jgi:hypothetical protein